MDDTLHDQGGDIVRAAGALASNAKHGLQPK